MNPSGKLEAQAAILKAANTAKHKALGKTHRIEVELYGPRGGYLRTAVLYVKTTEAEIAARVAAFVNGQRASVASSTFRAEAL